MNSQAFFLSPKNQDRLIAIMDQLKKEGYPTDNMVLTMVLRAMQERGFLPPSDDKEVLNIIKKVVKPGGKILHIKGDGNGRVA